MKKNVAVASPIAPAPAAADPAKKKIFLADDHPITRQGIAVLINQEPDLMVCGEAASAAGALDLIQKLKPDLAIIDISLKASSGLELIKNLKALLADLSILVMSMHDETLYAERALRAGAMGYVMKQDASAKVLTAIRTVLKGDFFISDQIKTRMLQQTIGHRRPELAASPVESLSDREMEVFQLIGNGFSTREIATRLNLSVKTIDSYREHLKLKLQLTSGADLVRYAIQWVKSEAIS
ncbi:MAG: response regulator transcription factor [Verrucomicrobia bacterium]|nr:response regulator transcription factor [Verrucomicrobiota bacterium]